jgi:hypothetical protein
MGAWVSLVLMLYRMAFAHNQKIPPPGYWHIMRLPENSYFLIPGTGDECEIQEFELMTFFISGLNGWNTLQVSMTEPPPTARKQS